MCSMLYVFYAVCPLSVYRVCVCRANSCERLATLYNLELPCILFLAYALLCINRASKKEIKREEDKDKHPFLGPVCEYFSLSPSDE